MRLLPRLPLGILRLRDMTGEGPVMLWLVPRPLISIGQEGVAYHQTIPSAEDLIVQSRSRASTIPPLL
jgi:hypothetical protein